MHDGTRCGQVCRVEEEEAIGEVSVVAARQGQHRINGQIKRFIMNRALSLVRQTFLMNDHLMGSARRMGWANKWNGWTVKCMWPRSAWKLVSCVACRRGSCTKVDNVANRRRWNVECVDNWWRTHWRAFVLFSTWLWDSSDTVHNYGPIT